MSMGLCIAGYKTGALHEILGTDDTLVDYGDVNALCSIIIHLLQNNDERVNLGKRNQDRAHQNFSVESMVEKYMQLYYAVDTI